MPRAPSRDLQFRTGPQIFLHKAGSLCRRYLRAFQVFDFDPLRAASNGVQRRAGAP